jgi:hypothetical protein
MPGRMSPIFFMRLSGVQLAMPTVPPGLATRNISEATTSGRGAIIAPNTEVTQSNRPGSNGRSSTSASPTRCPGPRLRSLPGRAAPWQA